MYHRYSASGGAYTPQKVYWVERNRIWTVVKTFLWYLAMLSPGYSFARYGVGLYSLLSGKGSVGKLSERHSAGDLFRAVARAYAEA